MRHFVVAVALSLSVFTASPVAAGNLFVTIPAVEFSRGSVTSFSFGQNGGSRFCDGTPCEILAQAPLPNGSRILGIEIDACRTANDDPQLSLRLIRRTGNEESHETLASVLYTDLGCDYETVAADSTKDLDVNTFVDEYILVVAIGSIDCLVSPISTPCPDSGSRFEAVRVYYAVNDSGGVVEPTKASDFTIF